MVSTIPSAERNSKMATAEWKQNGGNQALHYHHRLNGSASNILTLTSKVNGKTENKCIEVILYSEHCCALRTKFTMYSVHATYLAIELCSNRCQNLNQTNPVPDLHDTRTRNWRKKKGVNLRHQFLAHVCQLMGIN